MTRHILRLLKSKKGKVEQGPRIELTNFSLKENDNILTKMTIYCNNVVRMFDMSKNLGLSLEYLRKARGLTQAQLARISGIPRTTLSHMESGEGNPSLKTLSKLALVLGVAYEELIMRPKPKNPLSSFGRDHQAN